MPELSSLPIYASLVADLEEIAREIEIECSDVLLPAPKGIYVYNRLDPVMIDGGEYYILTPDKFKRDTIKKIVTDITDIKCAVYTEKLGKEVVAIPARIMRNKKTLMSNEPIMPYIGMKIVQCLIDKQIHDFLAYPVVAGNDDDALYRFFTNDPVTGEVISNIDPWICKINRAYDCLFKQLHAFLGGYKWHLFFTYIVGTRFRIEKSIDKRAYAWLLQQEQEKLNNE